MTFGLVNPEDLDGEALGALWAYLTQEWLQMKAPTSARIGRCKVDPRWQVVQSQAFEHAHTPAARVYFRRGAGAKHALGTWLSFAAHTGALAGGLRLSFPVLAPLALDATPEQAAAHDEEVKAALDKLLGEWCREGARLLSAELVKEHGARGALAYLLERGAAVLARASSVADGKVGPRPEDLRPRKKPRIVLWLRKLMQSALVA